MTLYDHEYIVGRVFSRVPITNISVEGDVVVLAAHDFIAEVIHIKSTLVAALVDTTDNIVGQEVN